MTTALISVFVLVLWFFRSCLLGKIKLIKDKLVLPVLVFLCICVFLGIAGGFLKNNSTRYIRLDIIVFFLYFFYVVLRSQFRKKEDVKNLMYVIVLGGFFASLLYVITFLLIPLDASQSGRVINRQVHFLMVSLFFLLTYLIWGKNKLIKRISFVFIFFISIALLICQTRGTWVSTLIGSFLILGIGLKEGKVSYKIFFRILVAVFFIFILILYLAQNKGFDIAGQIGTRAASVKNISQDPSAMMRGVLYLSALQKFIRSPIIGQGFGDTITVPAFFAGGIVKTVRWVDSTWISLLWKMGIIGFLTYAWLFLTAFWRTFVLYRKANDEITKVFSIGMLAVMLALSAISLISPLMIKYRFSFVWVFMFAGVEFLNQKVDEERLS
jgi:O-antigen ligase